MNSHSRALQKAIKLRQWVRRAIDIGDDGALRRLSRKADAAYAALSPDDAALYRDWAFDPETCRLLGLAVRR